MQFTHSVFRLVILLICITYTVQDGDDHDDDFIYACVYYITTSNWKIYYSKCTYSDATLDSFTIKRLIYFHYLFSSKNNPDHTIGVNQRYSTFPTTGTDSCNKKYEIDGKNMYLPRCSMILILNSFLSFT